MSDRAIGEYFMTAIAGLCVGLAVGAVVVMLLTEDAHAGNVIGRVGDPAPITRAPDGRPPVNHPGGPDDNNFVHDDLGTFLGRDAQIAKQFDADKAEKYHISEMAYLLGIETGLFVTVAQFKRAYLTEPVFCPPDGLIFAGPALMKMLQDRVQKQPGMALWPFQLALVDTLLADYPCRSAQR